MAARSMRNRRERIEHSVLICRLCLGENGLECIFKEEALHQWTADYLSVEVSADDRLSQYICAECRKRLTEFHQFRMRCHEIQDWLKHNKIENGQDEKQSTNFQCDVCQKDFKEFKQLYQHRRNHGSTVQCQICFRECKSKKLLADHMRVHGPKKHQCPRCDKSFVRRHNLESHVLHYHKEKLPKPVQPPRTKVESPDGSSCYKCDLCDMEYKYRESLFTHKKYIHGTKEHECRICGRLYSNRKRMLSHMESHGSSHDEKTPAINGRTTFRCNMCPKYFHLRRELQHHMCYVHVRNKHDCQICDLKFSSRRRLNWHLKAHHPPSESEASRMSSRKRNHSRITRTSNGTKKSSQIKTNPRARAVKPSRTGVIPEGKHTATEHMIAGKRVQPEGIQNTAWNGEGEDIVLMFETETIKTEPDDEIIS